MLKNERANAVGLKLARAEVHRELFRALASGEVVREEAQPGGTFGRRKGSRADPRRVPDATVAQLQSFYDNHTRGTILAPLPSLGNKIALGAWTTKDANDPTNGTAHLAKCTSFDEKAFGAFFDDFQFQGPERFPPNTLLPGHN